MRVAVAGAGIAGLTCGLALARDGHDVTIFERRTGFGEPGAGIQLSPNASRILLDLGIGSGLARSACEPEAVAVRRLRDGRPIGEVGFGAAMRERFGAPYWSIARSDLHTALLDAVRAQGRVSLKVGRAVSAATEGPSGVVLDILSEGGSNARHEADVAVAADGVGSSLRRHVSSAKPRLAEHTAFRATLPATAWPSGLGAADRSSLWLGPGRHLVQYPVASGRAVNLVLVARDPQSAIEGWNAIADADRVRRALGPAPPALVDLVAGATWTAWSLRDMRTDRMARGRLALVGDAAHPVLPYLAQGGGMAIEDAAVLAAELRGRGTPTQALARFEAARLPRVRRVQRAARGNGRAYHAGWPVASVRDATIRRLGPTGMSDRYAWIYGWTPPLT